MSGRPAKRRQSHDIQEASSSDEQKSNDGKGDSDRVVGTCRLRHGLNDDCRCEIFDFLDIASLIQLCELDIYYQNLITANVIGKKLVNFTEIGGTWTANNVFQVFGKNMRKIKIAEENTLHSFERFLNFIIQSCSVGMLTEIEVRYLQMRSRPNIMQEVMPFFSGLRKMVIIGPSFSYGQFLVGISTAAANLTHLTLESVNVSGEWLLLAGGMENLRELRLHKLKHDSMSIQTIELSEFLRTKSKLELFSYIGSDDIRPVADTLIEHCPKLNTFIDSHLDKPHRAVTSTIITELMKHRYDFVGQFNGLKVIGLTSYTQCGSDLYYPMMRMASKKMAAKIEELKFYIDPLQAIVVLQEPLLHNTCKAFDSFSSLKAVELQVRIDTYDQCEFNAEFICEFISKLTTVKKFNVISGYAEVRGINKVIDLAPNIEELGVAQVKMKYLPVEMRKIVVSIRKRRDRLIAEGQLDPKPFHVVVNENQLRELQVYKDHETILSTTRVAIKNKP